MTLILNKYSNGTASWLSLQSKRAFPHLAYEFAGWCSPASPQALRKGRTQMRAEALEPGQGLVLTAGRPCFSRATFSVIGISCCQPARKRGKPPFNGPKWGAKSNCSLFRSRPRASRKPEQHTQKQHAPSRHSRTHTCVHLSMPACNL